MDIINVRDKMINSLETSGQIRFVNEDMDIYIQQIDPKEGYSYIAQNGAEFDSSRDAVEWAIRQFNGIENIGRWE